MAHGSLIFTDLSRESLKRAVKLNLLIVLWIIFWLLGGMAYCKSCLATLVDFEISPLSWIQAVLEYLIEVKRSGGLVLITGSDEKYAQQATSSRAFRAF